MECEGADAATLASLAALPGVVRVTGDTVSARIEVDAATAVTGVMQALVAAEVTSLRVTRPSLEQVY